MTPYWLFFGGLPILTALLVGYACCRAAAREGTFQPDPTPDMTAVKQHAARLIELVDIELWEDELEHRTNTDEYGDVT